MGITATPPSNPPTNKHTDACALLALSAIVALFFGKMLFTNLIVARGDLFTYFYPYRDFAAAALREGRLPLWNPYLFMGAPFLANSQVGFFYPPNLALSWLDVTRAVNLSIVAHVWIAAMGAYAFARGRLDVSIRAAWLGGVSFGLGGYLGAQVEHFNQLQALAWLPWLWLAYDRAVDTPGSRARSIRASLLVGFLVGLMLLAGHAQSVFIALAGLSVYAAWPAIEQLRRPRQAAHTALARLAPLVFAVIAGGLLAAAQLLPTLELAGLSPRGGGLSLNEAVSFSLDPRLIGRALLPDYDGALPAGGEFTAFFGVSALVLAIIGLFAAWSPDRPTTWSLNTQSVQRLRAVSVIAVLGLFLALGGFNPIYYALIRIVPGFDLFRAPARWLALFAFGGSMLVAIGLDAVSRNPVSLRNRVSLLPLLVIALLIGTTYLGASITPAGATGPIGLPGGASLLLWGAATTLTLVLALGLRPRASNLPPPITNYQSLITLITCLELFTATRTLPYHARLTAPDALTSLRPSTLQLLAGATGAPPARFLSISDILFDPGDSAELEAIFVDQLTPGAYYDLLIASKQKEIAVPNLPLYYRLPAVDGYDGGLLPPRNYLTFQRLFLSPNAIQPDGRLREQLTSIPEARWLDLMNVKYVITDKVRDRWLDGVFYDLQFTTRLGPGQSALTDQLPPLEADALGIVYSEPAGNFTLAEVEITFADGSSRALPLVDEPIARIDGLAVTRLRWGEAKRVSAVRVRGSGGLTLHGTALIDERNGTFHSFVLAKDGRFRLAHSGDVKVYENMDALHVLRAFVVSDARFVASDVEAVATMQDDRFDPSQTVVLLGASLGPVHSSPVTRHLSLITHHLSHNTQYAIRNTQYAPEHISMEVTADSAGYLVLTDAWYPGWTATVDGEPVEILRADVAFRAVRIGVGTHRVEFRYEPQTVWVGMVIGVVAWVIGAIVTGISRTRRAPA